MAIEDFTFIHLHPSAPADVALNYGVVHMRPVHSKRCMVYHTQKYV